ncbi:MAG: hypothetical protein LQ350_006918 [Teloschistes chrysophthalmus]|nr:MAG: hypothetical protein LQ350_006918 [Niorma chrysophthalma]
MVYIQFQKRQADQMGLKSRLVEAYRKNYCPKTPPPLVLPTAPRDDEKDCYLDMQSSLLFTVGIVVVLCIAVGSWTFAKSGPLFAWYGVYALVTQLYILASLFIPLIGKPFDHTTHKKLLSGIDLDDRAAPTVDVYLPVCNKPLEVLETTWRHVAKLRYPNVKLSVFVLDDGALESVKHMAQRFGFTYIVRPNRPELKKAGTLRHAFSQTTGPFFTVFDADFCPRPEFLLETIPYMMADPKRAILQTPQYFRSMPDQTWVEQGAAAMLENYYRVMQVSREEWGASMCAGSNAIYRRTALEPVGGTIPVAHSEDNYTGVYVVSAGWTIKYIPLVLACGNSPDTPIAY